MTNLACFSAVKRTEETPGRPAVVPPYIHAVFVGDRSGSMCAMGEAPIEGIAEFMEYHRKIAEENPHSQVVVDIYTFDSVSELVYSGKAKKIKESDIQRAKDLMRPRNTTRLFDTAIEALKSQRKAINRCMLRVQIPHTKKDRKDPANMANEVKRLEPKISSSFTLLTDGDDNESEHSCRDLNKMIREQTTQYGTSCLFAAANQDAMNSGEMYGFSRDCSLQIGEDVDEARAAFRACSQAAVRSATNQSSGFTQSEREKSCSITFDNGYSGGEYSEEEEEPHNYGAARC